MINIDVDNLKNGVLGLVVALVEVIRDALRIQAIKRMESGILKDNEIERLGEALMELDLAIEQIKEDQGIIQSVQSVRDSLDSIVEDVLDKMINPQRWVEDNGEGLSRKADVGGFQHVASSQV